MSCVSQHSSQYCAMGVFPCSLYGPLYSVVDMLAAQSVCFLLDKVLIKVVNVAAAGQGTQV